jgi:hypothetical protein
LRIAGFHKPTFAGRDVLVEYTLYVHLDVQNKVFTILGRARTRIRTCPAPHREPTT